MEIIFELLFQVVFELVGQAVFEALFQLFGRSYQATHADLFGRGERSWTWRAVAYTLLVAVAGGFGLWRGSVADGFPTFGFWAALGVATACGVAMILGLPRVSEEPPEGAWDRVLRWWPRRRLAWFATGNATFAIAYLAAM